ncbi:MAG: selenium metabolism-associated LysR family transcriptional regulator [Bacillota bacterium]|nr:selenium metabolism-associated LysR family transcriptional regulator [Bacillota bacterium]
MNLDYLNSLINIVEYKSFSHAARKLFITQPTISNHISKLEDELNTVLLIRTKKEVKLTKQGEIIYTYALNALQMENNIKNRINEFNQTISGNLEIASSTIPERYFLLDKINEFHKEYFNVIFSLKRYDSCKIIDLLLNSKIDFGIIGTKVINPNLQYQQLFEDEIVLIGNSTYFNDIDKIELDELFNYNFVSRETGSGTRKETELFFKSNNLNYNKLNIIFEIEDNDCILDILSKNKYLSFLSKKVLLNCNENDFKIIDFGYKINRQFYFAYNKNRIMSPLSEKFKKFILKNDVL